MNRTSISSRSPVHPVRWALVGLLLAGLFATSTAFASDSPSLIHTYFMRGQIVEIQDTSAVICIGRADGASVGQELDVVRHRRVSPGHKGQGRFKREVVGKLRIDEIVDEHYAEASVISGEAGKNDIVEFLRSRE